LDRVIVMPCRESVPASSFHRQVEENTDLVELIARIVRRTHPQVSMEDFQGAGHIGLVQAARRYRPGSGASFRTFASRRIRGEMLELVRRRHLRENSNPSVEDAFEFRTYAHPERSPQVYGKTGNGERIEIADHRASEAAAAVETRCRVVSILDHLPPNEAEALQMRFMEERPLRDVAGRLGISTGEARNVIDIGLARARLVEQKRVA